MYDLPKPEIPKSLLPLINNALAYALQGDEMPKLNELYEWLECDGWDLMLEAWESEEMAIRLANIAEYHFNDQECCENQDLDEDEVNDAVRIVYAKVRIQAEIDSGNTTDIPSVHSFKLQSEKEGSPVIGCLVEIHGQLGPVLDWQGVFKNKDSFLQKLRDDGLVLLSELDSIDDQKIILLWEK